MWGEGGGGETIFIWKSPLIGRLYIWLQYPLSNNFEKEKVGLGAQKWRFFPPQNQNYKLIRKIVANDKKTTVIIEKHGFLEE